MMLDQHALVHGGPELKQIQTRQMTQMGASSTALRPIASLQAGSLIPADI